MPVDSEASPAVEIRVVTPERWDDLVQLFERKGPRGGIPIPGHCWCMAWRDEQGPRGPRRAAMKDIVECGERPGLLAYLDGRPVGWVAVAPREDHSRLERSRKYGPLPGDRNVFAVTCFYVEPKLRGTGIAGVLLDAAIDHARASGATALDAFPKPRLSPHATASRRAEENDSWMGRLAWYEARDFVRIRDAGARTVMRLSFDGAEPKDAPAL
ncbi:GNAT family N-acetyltransferase [Kribbella sp. NPDC048915]|uniref:GNAT family N-acetyltransferase n=1 Tax=Kribbella sp. NPDC048915 TaxID=3155148 RepID=UPI0034024A6F